MVSYMHTKNTTNVRKSKILLDVIKLLAPSISKTAGGIFSSISPKNAIVYAYGDHFEDTGMCATSVAITSCGAVEYFTTAYSNRRYSYVGTPFLAALMALAGGYTISHPEISNILIYVAAETASGVALKITDYSRRCAGNGVSTFSLYDAKTLLTTKLHGLNIGVQVMSSARIRREVWGIDYFGACRANVIEAVSGKAEDFIHELKRGVEHGYGRKKSV